MYGENEGTELYEEIKRNLPKLERALPAPLLLEFMQAPADDLGNYRAGLGTMVWLKLLRPKQVLYRTFLRAGVPDREEMVMIVIRELHKKNKSL